MEPDNPKHQKTIFTENWFEEDWETNPKEAKIMTRLNLKPNMQPFTKHQTNKEEEVNQFRRPQKDFIKLNFDGAAKGNLGEAGTRGIFRDNRGRTLIIYVMDCGNATINDAELHALKKGLEIAIREKYQKLQVEGVSKMATEIVKKLQQGSQWEKISRSWRTASLVQEISKLTRQIDYILPKHVRRKGNATVDNLAN